MITPGNPQLLLVVSHAIHIQVLNYKVILSLYRRYLAVDFDRDGNQQVM